jgi:hypothetical protein
MASEVEYVEAGVMHLAVLKEIYFDITLAGHYGDSNEDTIDKIINHLVKDGRVVRHKS